MGNVKSERNSYHRQNNEHGARVLRTQKEPRSARAEEALREYKEELEAIFNDVRDGIVLLDMTGKILKINRRVTEATGYTEEDIVGKRFKSLKMFTPKSIARMLFRFSKSLAGIEILPYEVEGYTKTGEKRIAEISGSLLRKREKAVGVITVMRDITERKRAEEALSESEKRFKIIFETQQNGTLIIDAHSHTIVDVNTYAAGIIGLPREDIIGKSCHSFICPAEKGQCPVSDLRQTIDQSERILIQTEGNRIPILKSVVRTTINGQELFIESFQDITERKRAEEALQSAYASLKESETRYRTLVDNINLGVNLIDADHNILMANTAEGNQFNKPVIDLIGKKCFREFEKRDAVCPHCPGVRAMATGKPAEVETEGVRDDGNRYNARLQAFPAFGHDGTVTGFIEVSEDITDRVRSEEALRASEERYRSLYEDNPSMYFTVDAEGMVLSVNQYGAKHLGYKVKELVGQPVLNVFYEDDKEAVRQHLTTCMKEPAEVFHWEFRKVRKDGDIMWVKEAVRTVRGVDGKPVVLIVCEDITKRKVMEEALRQSEATLKKAQEVGHVGSWHLDLKKNELIWSDEACRIFGIPQGTVLTFEEFLEAVHPDDREYVGNAWTVALDKELYDIDHRIIVNGEVKWVREKAGLELGDKVKGIRATGTVQDITDKKRAEEELKKSFERLRKGLESTVSALASTVEMRDPYTAGHQQRVADLACAIAEEMGLSDEHIHGIRFAGLIHDIGKINIPVEILNKPGQLKEIEYSFFKHHPQVGYDVLKTIEFPWPVAQIVLQHHERMDGSGYPQGLSGTEIILEARILAVADIVEAIATHRPYRPARGIGDALEEILHNKGTFYDPDVVDACLRVFYEKGFKFD